MKSHKYFSIESRRQWKPHQKWNHLWPECGEGHSTFHLKAMGEFYPAVWEWKSKPAAKKTFFSDEYPKENRLLITAVILKITVKKCFWLFRDNTHPFLFLSNCLQNPLGLCSVSVWSHVESYAGIVSSITVQKQESCRNPRNPEKYWIFQKQNRNHIYKWL